MKTSLLVIMYFVPLLLCGQIDTVYSEKYLKRSTKFAWTTLGLETFFLPGGTTSIWSAESSSTLDFGPSFTPRITIGGIHFWGHVDFYVSFPLRFLRLRSVPANLENINYSHGIETGARIYPWKLRPNSIRPFFGASFKRMSFSQEQKDINYEEGGAVWQKVIYPFQTGVSFTGQNYMITAVLHWQSSNDFEYFLTPTQTGTVEVSPLSVNVGIIKTLDLDAGIRTKEGIEQENLKHHILKKEKRLSAWYAGLGPSASFQMSESPFISNGYPFLSNDRLIGIMPDITIGRYFSRPDMNVGLSYRRFSGQLRAFDTKIQAIRNSYMLESYKFLFNWLGFVPFFGLTGSLEDLYVSVNDQKYQEIKPAVGFIFGWDIRVTRTGTSLLRTNLRYIPNLNMNVQGEKMMFDHLEINFIQWIYFFGRKRAYQKYSS